MKTGLEKFKVIIIVAISIMLFSSCSHSDNDQTTFNDEESNDNFISNEGAENDLSESDPEENVPMSEFLISKISVGSVFFISKIDVSSEFEKEIMETLTEYHAVGMEDGMMLTVPEDILFDYDSDQLRSEADKAIQQLVQVIETTDGNVTIIGHTDSHGEDDYNQRLSEGRAEAVLQALSDSGIESGRLSAEGRGANEPVANNTHSDGSDNPEGRQENRRVEVIVHGFN